MQLCFEAEVARSAFWEQVQAFRDTFEQWFDSACLFEHRDNALTVKYTVDGTVHVLSHEQPFAFFRAHADDGLLQTTSRDQTVAFWRVLFESIAGLARKTENATLREKIENFDQFCSWFSDKQRYNSCFHRARFELEMEKRGGRDLTPAMAAKRVVDAWNSKEFTPCLTGFWLANNGNGYPLDVDWDGAAHTGELDYSPQELCVFAPVTPKKWELWTFKMDECVFFVSGSTCWTHVATRNRDALFSMFLLRAFTLLDTPGRKWRFD